MKAHTSSPILGVLLAGIVGTLPARAQLPPVDLGPISVEVETVVSGLSSVIALVSANDGSGRLFLVEQPGRIRILKNGALTATPFLDVTAQTQSGGEEGLLGLAFHPGFSNPSSPGYRRLYTFWTQAPGTTSDFGISMTGPPANQGLLTEWQVSASNPDVVDLATRRDLMRIDHPQMNHNAGHLAFRASDGYLYLSLGDGGGANDTGNGHTPGLGNAQDTTNLLGKILRIDPLDPARTPASLDPISRTGKYRIPRDNPFAGSVTNLNEIYAFGFRNPYRFSFDPPNDQLIVADVGQNAIEEVDLVSKGGNYGWNRKEGSFLFNSANGSVSPDPSPDPALTDPVLEYDHDDGSAIIGGFVYRGSAIPALRGRYLFGDFQRPGSSSGGRLFSGDLSARTLQELRLGLTPRALRLSVKGFGLDDAGEIYLLADGLNFSNGQVLRLVPVPATVQLLNFSTRARVEADDNGLVIAGFIITGSAPKTVVLRGLGPSLQAGGQPLAGRLLDPTLSLFNADGSLRETNDDWMTHPRAAELAGFGLQPNDSREAAIVATLPPGAYTAILRGVAGATGIALVEAYDVARTEPANIVNLATRGRVQSGNDAMIAGFIIGGTTAQQVLVTALGPSLSARGVSGALPDPTVELIDANGQRIVFNDDWQVPDGSAVAASGVAPTNSFEAAAVRTLNPGAYTALVRGSGARGLATTGVALVQVFRLD